MRALVGLVAALGMAGPSLAIECPVSHAIYGQPGRQVALVFSEVRRDAASNQIASFAVRIEGVTSRLSGSIYVPNGFGQPQGFVERDCTGVEDECTFWTNVAYVLGDDGIEEYPYDPNRPLIAQMAPRQVLLPGLASNVWYSDMRAEAFSESRTMGDVFTLAACAK